jgi:hypothetical protein
MLKCAIVDTGDLPIHQSRVGVRLRTKRSRRWWLRMVKIGRPLPPTSKVIIVRI